MKRLKEYTGDLKSCVKCGTCRSVCPTLRAIGTEPGCARGRLTLVDAYLKGEIPLTDTFERRIRDCTLCGACVSACPKGVDTPAIMTAARADIFDKKGASSVTARMMKHLDSARLVGLALKFASRIQGVLLRPDASGGFLTRFPLPLVGGGRLLPGIARTFFMDTPEARELRPKDNSADKPEKDKKTPRVAFYVGCGINYLMPDVGRATVDSLKRAGAEVVVPEAQVCCGMPAFASGDVVTARNLAVKNLEAFEGLGADFIVTSCATCGHGLKNVFHELLGDDPAVAARVEAFSSRVRDITELLARELNYAGVGERPGRNEPGKKVVTYHDPCHLGRYQDLREAPRELIRRSPGVELKEMKHPCSCCGLGGGVGMNNYELSMEVARQKAESVRDSGASVVVTACPGCMVQLRDALNRYGVEAEVAHVVELI